MQVRNQGLKKSELNVGGRSYKSDDQGVFDVPDQVGEMLLQMPGYQRPRETREKRRAYLAFKEAESAFKEAEGKLDQAREALLAAQAQADRGEGTDLGEDADAPAPPVPALSKRSRAKLEPEEPPKKPEPKMAPRTQAALRAKNGGEPNMKWSLEDLRDFARDAGIDVQDDWHKVQIYGEIEALDGE